MNNLPVQYPPAYYRFRARRALKGHWLTALQIALIVSLLPWLIRGIFTYVSGDMNAQMLVIQNAMLNGTASYQQLNQFLVDYGPRIALFAGLNIAAYLIIPCLTLGMIKWFIDRLKGLEDPVSAVFCRVRLFFKACGLQILIYLKLLLWMLPGIALTFLASFVLGRLITAHPDRLAFYANAVTFVSFYLLLPAMIVPAFLAYLRYALAEYVMADKPETGIRESIRRSKVLMKKNKRIIVMNILFFFLLMLVSSILAGFPGVLYYLLTLFFSLVISVYWTGTVSAFYLDAEYGPAIKSDPAAEPDPEELN